MSNLLKDIGIVIGHCVGCINGKAGAKELSHMLREIAEEMRVERPEKPDPEWEFLLNEVESCCDELDDDCC